MKKLKQSILVAVFLMALLVSGCNTKNNSGDTKEATTTEGAQVATATPTPAATEVATVEPTKQAESSELLIAAAASLQNAMEEIKPLYEAAEGVTLTFTYGSSGALQEQIEQGAPVDIFMSAALKQMKALEDSGLILEGSKKELLENKVVLIVPKDSTLDIASFDDIIKAETIALGDPASVPVGQYSEEIFTSLGILDQVKKKVTYGKDVTEVLTWIATGNADAGVVYATDAKSSADVKVIAEAPEGSVSKAIYPVAVIKDSKLPDAARAFVEYLSSEEAIGVFEKYGFLENK